MATRVIWPSSVFLTQTGKDIGVSDWFALDQRRIDEFATVTDDDQFIHTDPKRARDSPFGGTIAHGFLTLSLLSAMQRSCLPMLEGVKAELNYGFDKIRFLSPVPSGSRVRARFTLSSFTERDHGRWLISLKVAIEIEYPEKTALVADWLILCMT